jgi:protein-disulfide isomerase
MRWKSFQQGFVMSMLRVPVTPDDHIQGPFDAPVTLVEYGDYQCPFCGLTFPNVNLVQKRFSKVLRFVFRHFPLTEAHPLAEPAAEAAEYAGTHHRFWEMHDGLYANQDQLGLTLILALGRELGLSDVGLRDALAQRRFADKLNADFVGGVRSGVNGTPSFFINGVKHQGSYSFDELAAAIDARLHAGAAP